MTAAPETDKADAAETSEPAATEPAETGEATTAPATDEAEDATTEEPTEDAAGDCQPPVEGAYDCAGGPLPDEAQEVSSVDTYYDLRTASFVTPSGNIGCDILVTGEEPPTMACEVVSWMSDGAPVEPAGGYSDIGRPVIEFGDGAEEPFYGGSKGDPFCFMEGACSTESGDVFRPQVVEYGQVVHYEGFACASEESGMTCWHINSGHGAVFSRDTLRTF